jgi:hypothetical protein
MPKVYTVTRQLSAKQVQFLDLYAVNQNAKQSALSVGWSATSARQMAYRTLRHPRAQGYLRSLQSESRAIVAYDLATAMKESLEVISYAKEKGNAMAYFKAVEHRAKLSGLLIDRVMVEKVDLTAALEAARSRVADLTILESKSLPTEITHISNVLQDNV